MKTKKLIELTLDRKPIGEFDINTKEGLQIESYSLIKLLHELEKDYKIIDILGTKSIHRILNSKDYDYNKTTKGMILYGYEINIVDSDLAIDLDNKFYIILKDCQDITQYCAINVRGTVKTYRRKDGFKTLNNAVVF